ncbi:hypothetical protein FZI93_24610, partial [Mycobacterium sp. CBMA361]|nr:hypothetical protein [Mycolicibacterium sp. CBMA 361]
GESVGLVPDFEYEDDTDDAEVRALSWTVYSLPSAPPVGHFELGEEEYRLRDAVRSAADALGRLRAEPGSDIEDPREMVEQLLVAGQLHRVPDHAPTRAVRVLETAAHIDAIITVSAGLAPIGLQSASEMQIASEAMRPLTDIVRSARLAAVTAILHSAWERWE